MPEQRCEGVIVTTTPKNWNNDGWQFLDWRTVGVYSHALTKVASDLENEISADQAEKPTPYDLLDIADRTTAIANRLRELAQGYM
jgi:hypothetical protein